MRALNKKEKQKKNDRSLLFDGKAQVLSSDKFLAEMTHQAERREAETAQKAKNAKTWASRREAVAQVEEEWKKIKEMHDVNVQAWEAECKALASEGHPKKEWPKKPTRPQKPQVSTFEQVPEAADDKQEHGDDDDFDDEPI
ncbi:hypothetical protein H0H87_004338 [Tephrocybe sp. NHM501043]|nr:hypothetical protein H0H87_004338 [Tephrocybe sp. NHM501043]